jgi:hypothetical protein
MKRILWSLVLILGMSVFCSAQNLFYLPQIADGVQTSGIGWITGIAITNPAATGTAMASGTITFRQDNGNLWNLTFNDEQNRPVGSGSSIPFQVAGGQTRFFISTGMSGALTTGYAAVSSNLAVAGGAVFIEFGNVFAPTPTRIGQAGVPSSSALTRQSVIAIKTNSENTGVAVASPGGSAATVTFQLLDTNGTPVLSAVNRPIVTNGHTAFFVSELFPTLPSGFYGTMQITSSTPVAVLSLLFEDTGLFTTLPVFPLQ